MGFRRIRPRKIPLQRNEERASEFKKTFKILFENLEVWFCDESGIEGDSPLRLVWSLTGKRKTCYYSGNHLRDSVVGAVNPKTGAFESLILPTMDTEAFQYFLDFFNERLRGRYVLMVLDNATWHKAKSLRWGTILPVYLPPYSPDLNPIEILWKVLKDRLFNEMPPEDNDELQDRIQAVIREFHDHPEEVMSICKVKY